MELFLIGDVVAGDFPIGCYGENRKLVTEWRLRASTVLGNSRFDSHTRTEHGSVRRKHLVHRGPLGSVGRLSLLIAELEDTG